MEETNQFPCLCLDLILWSSPNQPLLGKKGNPIMPRTYTTSDLVYFRLSLGSGSWIPLSYCGWYVLASAFNESWPGAGTWHFWPFCSLNGQRKRMCSCTPHQGGIDTADHSKFHWSPSWWNQWVYRTFLQKMSGELITGAQVTPNAGFLWSLSPSSVVRVCHSWNPCWWSPGPPLGMAITPLPTP